MNPIDLLRNTRLFNKIDEAQLAELASHVKEVKFLANETIIKEGDPADSLYIIKEGVLQVFTHDVQEQEIILARLEKGFFFGEQALLATGRGKRNANIRTLTDATLLKVDHSDFLKIIESDAELKSELKTTGVKQLLHKLRTQESEFDISKHLIDEKNTFETREFGAGAIISAEGDAPDGAYFLLSGSVDVLKGGELIRSIAPGNLFGEFGIALERERQATIKAQDNVKTLFIPIAQFKQLCIERPKLKEIIDTLQHIYRSIARGEVIQHTSHFLHMPAIISKFHLKDNREITSTYVIGKNIRLLNESAIKNPSISSYEDKKVYRELQFADNRLVGVIAYGEWDALQELYARVFDKRNLTDIELKNFNQHGNITLPEAIQPVEGSELIICNCMYISKGTISTCIKEGSTTVEEVGKITGAGTICGSCVPTIQSMLGHKSWKAMHIIKVEKLTPEIWSYKLAPVQNKPLNPFQTGQHVVIQCEIDGHWVERSYTLVSAPNNPMYYEIVIKREEKGLFSRWMFDNWEKVPFIRISNPTGNFSFNITASNPLVCFTAGIGITPAVGFVRALLERETSRSLFIYAVGRNKERLAYNAELESISSKSSKIQYTNHFSEEKGRMKSEDIKKIIQQHPEADFFICGTKDFEAMVKSTLKDSGISENRILIEQFIHTGGPAPK